MLDPNKNYYDTFTEAHDFAKRVMKDFPEVGVTEVGYDRGQGAYTVKFNKAAFDKAHPMQWRGR